MATWLSSTITTSRRSWPRGLLVRASAGAGERTGQVFIAALLRVTSHNVPNQQPRSSGTNHNGMGGILVQWFWWRLTSGEKGRIHSDCREAESSVSNGMVYSRWKRCNDFPSYSTISSHLNRTTGHTKTFALPHGFPEQIWRTHTNTSNKRNTPNTTPTTRSINGWRCRWPSSPRFWLPSAWSATERTTKCCNFRENRTGFWGM